MHRPSHHARAAAAPSRPTAAFMTWAWLARLLRALLAASLDGLHARSGRRPPSQLKV